MTLASFVFGTPEPIVLIRRTVSGQDTYNDDVYAETTETVQGAFAPGTSTEVQQGGDQVTATPQVFLPTGTEVASVDAVIARNVTYEVQGVEQDWISPFTGWAPGVVINLKVVTG